MTKRCLCPVAICFIFGLIYSLRNIKWILIPFGILNFYIFLKLTKYNMLKRALVMTGLVFATFIFGVLWGYKTENKREKYIGYLEDGQEILVQGRLSKKETKNNRNYLYLDKGRVLINDASVPCEGIVVLSESLDYVSGNTLVIQGRYREFESARNEGNYDEKETYNNKGFDIKVDSIKSIEVYGKNKTFRETLYLIKEDMKQALVYHLGEEYYAPIAAIVLGDKTEVSQEEKELYKNAGLSHILSVSGLHISILCMGLYGILKKIKCPRLVAATVAVFFAVTFCIFSGESISTQRAVGMFVIAILAAHIGEASDMISSLSLMAIVVLTSAPQALFSPGFLLSFGAVLGISVTGKILVDTYLVLAKRRDFLKSYNRHKSKKKRSAFVVRIQKYFDSITSLILMNIAIFITTFPIVIWFYYEVPTLSLIINMLVIPLMGLLLGIGFIGSLLGAIYLPLGVVVMPAKLVIEFYRIVAGLASRCPFSSWIIGRPKMAGIIVYYGVLLVLLGVIKYAKGFFMEEGYEGGRAIVNEIRVFHKKNAIYLASVLACSIFLMLMSTGFVDKRPCVKMLDVGQGDGIFIRTKNRDVFVDGGSSSVKEVGKYRMMPFLKFVGANKIDYWFVSHPDEDHICGLIEAIESGYKIKNVIVSSHIVKNELYSKLSVLCEKENINMIGISADDILELGYDRFICLYPYEDNSSTNESSMVLLYQSKDIELLLTGDIGKEGERDLVSKYEFEKSDRKRILKVAHHGSKNSSDEKLLKAFSPEAAIISVGKNNSYGHPSKETLSALEENNIIIKRTDIQGEIILDNKK